MMRLLSIGLISVLMLVLYQPPAFAHPEDEFCTEDSGLDPQLCRELSKLDSASASFEAGAGTYGTTTLEPIELDRPAIETLALYVKLGFLHILPKGYDHILFVLALFLAATNMRGLIVQVTAFTIAHTITLGMAATGVIAAPASIIEPLIALSIVVVAIENILIRNLSKWRPAIIFGFGLFHGVGFAGVLSGLGLVQNQFLTSLLGFNIGVELGQIAVISLAFAAVLIVCRIASIEIGTPTYRKWIVFPSSAIIALFGLFWFFSRLPLAG